MPWTWAEIREQWCFGGTVAASPDDIVAAFDLVEARLGRDWIDAKQPKANEILMPGALCADVLALGRQLSALGDAPGVEVVLGKIRAGDASARSELVGAYLCCMADPDVSVEFGVAVAVGGRTKVPDFRLRKPAEPWTWVEVSTPEQSDAADGIRRVLDRFAPLKKLMPFGLGGEIFIRRDITSDEFELISQAFADLLAQPTPSRRDIEGLALLLSGHFEPATVKLEDRGEAPVPRLSTVWADAVGDVGNIQRRALLVRHAFSDARAKRFLTREAAQLPSHEPGLVMLHSPTIWGPNPPWIPLLERLLRPSQHTRVSAVALFASRFADRTAGLAPVDASRLVINRHAKQPAPDWLLARLQAAAP
jgi:hypothetical protein